MAEALERLMRTQRVLLISLLAACAAVPVAAVPPPAAAPAPAAQTWTEGRDYYLVIPEQRTSVPPGKIEVLEVFSYGCPACNTFQSTIALLKKSLPPKAQLAYLPASFIPAEDWPMLQRAYFAAEALGIAERTHQAMYDAVWKNGELATMIAGSNRLKTPQPTIEDAARAYARWTGVPAADFLAAANSFGVDAKMRAADAQVLAMHVPSTPCIVVNGRYRVSETVRNGDQLIALVRYLIGKDSAR
jgi:thiol:disulfide interchange protein DsbA